MQIHKSWIGNGGKESFLLCLRLFTDLKVAEFLPSFLSSVRNEKCVVEIFQDSPFAPLLGPNDLNAKRMEMQKYPRSFWLRANKSEKRWRVEFSW